MQVHYLRFIAWSLCQSHSIIHHSTPTMMTAPGSNKFSQSPSPTKRSPSPSLTRHGKVHRALTAAITADKERRIQQAIAELTTGKHASASQAAAANNVSKTTLSNHMKGTAPKSEAHAKQQTLPPVVETAHANHIKLSSHTWRYPAVCSLLGKQARWTNQACQQTMVPQLSHLTPNSQVYMVSLYRECKDEGSGS